LKIASDRTLGRLQQQSSTTVPSGLNSADAVSAKALRGPRHLGVFFSHVNRSGAGSLLNPASARAAQLEAPRVSLQPQRRTVRRSQAPQAVTESSSPPALSSRLRPISLSRSVQLPHILSGRDNKLITLGSRNDRQKNLSPRFPWNHTQQCSPRSLHQL
jgi:hypothetical protein